MKNAKFVYMLIILFLSFVIAGCSKSSSNAWYKETAMNKSVPEAPLDVSPQAASKSAPASFDAEGTGGSSFAVPEGRKLIFTATVEMVVANPLEIAKIVDTELKNFGAYVSSQDIYENSISYEIRVPVDKLGRFLELFPNLGKVRRKTIHAQDVTDYYYDLENRVKNKKILVERYQTYLKSAKNVEDLLNIERFLNDATSELESLEGSFKKLVKQVDYATVSLLIEPEVKTGSSRPTLWERLRNLFAEFGAGLQTFVVIIVAIVMYGIPLLLVVLLFWWLLFGRIGLVKKLFNLVRAKKPSA